MLFAGRVNTRSRGGKRGRGRGNYEGRKRERERKMEEVKSGGREDMRNTSRRMIYINAHAHKHIHIEED